MKLQVASLAALVAAPSVLLPLLLLLGHQTVQFIRIDRVADMIMVLLTGLATMMAHELLHGVAYRALGYRVTYGLSLHPIAAYVAAFGQWHRRNRSIATALAPTVVLTAVCTPLLTLSSPTAVLVGLIALSVNASAVVGDLYLAWCLFRMPQGTLFYPVDMETTLVYVPVAQGEEG
jgi:predicted neutral ceramidase superfamily lipid hydrolase